MIDFRGVEFIGVNTITEGNDVTLQLFTENAGTIEMAFDAIDVYDVMVSLGIGLMNTVDFEAEENSNVIKVQALFDKLYKNDGIETDDPSCA